MFYACIAICIVCTVWLVASNHALRRQWRSDQEVIEVQRDIIDKQRERNREQERKLTAIWKLFSNKDSRGL